MSATGEILLLDRMTQNGAVGAGLDHEVEDCIARPYSRLSGLFFRPKWAGMVILCSANQDVLMRFAATMASLPEA